MLLCARSLDKTKIRPVSVVTREAGSLESVKIIAIDGGRQATQHNHSWHRMCSLLCCFSLIIESKTDDLKASRCRYNIF